MNADSPLRPVIVVGAARSGTKILRDSLALATGVPAVPYDIGYVWRHGNERADDDCQLPADITPKTRRLVRSFLGRYADQHGRVVEKTVGNTLRMPYVAALVPDGVFVHLIRDGVDVAESARREWRAPVEWRYLVRKAGHFPLRLAPRYGSKFLWNNTFGRRRQGGEHVSTWGPRYRGIDEDLARDGLLAVTARQWRACIEAAQRDLSSVPCVAEVVYEELVANPRVVLTQVAHAVGWETQPEGLDRAVSMIRPRRAVAVRAKLSKQDRSLLDTELGDLLEELAYECP